jgi:hypothetical protein
LGGTAQEVSRCRGFVERRRRIKFDPLLPIGAAYSVTGFSEICQALPSKIEMWSVFIGE